jgi:mannan endo-1,4-beta-mannosidase
MSGMDKIFCSITIFKLKFVMTFSNTGYCVNDFYKLCIKAAFLIFVLSSCHHGKKNPEVLPVDSSLFILPVEKPVDTLLTPETRALWLNLKRMQGKGILFGHQDATTSGVDWKSPETRSDVREVTGTFPALYGWEISGIGNVNNIDSIPFVELQKRIAEAYSRHGVNTVTWHFNNPVTGGTAWDTSPAVRDILPDSSLNPFYKSQLKQVASFFRQLTSRDGVPVPVIFRPFHENNGNWFWWGKGHCTRAEYIRLWRFTVSYLRDSLQVHNLLYAYSTDIFESPEQYLERYPGDAWVDILGCENYWDFQSGATISNGIAQLRMLVNISASRKKLAALTECGFDGIPVKNWWTQYLLTPIKDDSIARNISYLMVWRNANRKHYYVPFKGQKSAPDFQLFEQDTFTLFERDLGNLYEIKGQGIRNKGQAENAK